MPVGTCDGHERNFPRGKRQVFPSSSAHDASAIQPIRPAYQRSTFPPLKPMSALEQARRCRLAYDRYVLRTALSIHADHSRNTFSAVSRGLYHDMNHGNTICRPRRIHRRIWHTPHCDRGVPRQHAIQLVTIFQRAAYVPHLLLPLRDRLRLQRLIVLLAVRTIHIVDTIHGPKVLLPPIRCPAAPGLWSENAENTHVRRVFGVSGGDNLRLWQMLCAGTARCGMECV